jgi:hypothetical protein
MQKSRGVPRLFFHLQTKHVIAAKDSAPPPQSIDRSRGHTVTLQARQLGMGSGLRRNDGS